MEIFENGFDWKTCGREEILTMVISTCFGYAYLTLSCAVLLRDLHKLTRAVNSTGNRVAKTNSRKSLVCWLSVLLSNFRLSRERGAAVEGGG